MTNYEKSDALDNTAEAILESLDTAYKADALRPVYLDPVFESIRMEQIELSKRIFGSVGEAQGYAENVCTRFERECTDKGFIPRLVRLSGSDIHMPRQGGDPFTGHIATYSVPIDQEEGDAALIAQQVGIDGLFAGLGYRLMKLNPDQENDDTHPIPCKASLSYQVRVGAKGHLSGYTELFATGEVLRHELEFSDDRQKRELREIREELSVVEFQDIAALIDGVIQLLSTYGDYTPRTLKKIASMIDVITSSRDFKANPRLCDTVEDLLAHYIDLSEDYVLTTPDALLKTADDYMPVVMSNEEPFCYEHKLAAIALAPRYHNRGGRLVISKNHKVPYLVGEKDGEIYYLPLGRLTSFYEK